MAQRGTARHSAAQQGVDLGFTYGPWLGAQDVHTLHIHPSLLPHFPGHLQKRARALTDLKIASPGLLVTQSYWLPGTDITLLGQLVHL